MITFKNIQPYRLPDARRLPTAVRLELMLQEHKHHPLPADQRRSAGWSAPSVHEPDRLVVTSNGAHLIALKIEEKILPGSVINEEVKNRALQIEREQGCSPGRRQMREIKDLVTQDLLPRAFSRFKVIRALIDVTDGFIFVDTSSTSQAEEVLERLRRAIGDLAAGNIMTIASPAARMTEWLSNEPPENFTVDDRVKMEAAGTGGQVQIKNQSLDNDVVRNHVHGGQFVSELALTYHDRVRVSFVLTDKLQLKQIAILDEVTEEVRERDIEDAAEFSRAMLFVMVAELRQTVQAVIEAVGGEPSPQYDLVSKAEAEADPEYENAVELVVAGQRASTSYVQRMLNIGYNRAATLVERMEHEGIVSPMRSDGSRTVLRGIGT